MRFCGLRWLLIYFCHQFTGTLTAAGRVLRLTLIFLVGFPALYLRGSMGQQGSFSLGTSYQDAFLNAGISKLLCRALYGSLNFVCQ